MMAMRRILRYLSGTLTYGVVIQRAQDFGVATYCDADWGDYTLDQKSRTDLANIRRRQPSLLDVTKIKYTYAIEHQSRIQIDCDNDSRGRGCKIDTIRVGGFGSKANGHPLGQS